MYKRYLVRLYSKYLERHVSFSDGIIFKGEHEFMHFSRPKTALLALTKIIATMSILVLIFGCEQVQVDETTTNVEEESHVVSIATPISKEPVLGFSQLG